MTVTGYIGKKIVGSQRFDFKPSGTTSTKMRLEKVGLWGRGLTKVVFETAKNAAIATLFDDVKYTLYE